MTDTQNMIWNKDDGEDALHAILDKVRSMDSMTVMVSDSEGEARYKGAAIVKGSSVTVRHQIRDKDRNLRPGIVVVIATINTDSEDRIPLWVTKCSVVLDAYSRPWHKTAGLWFGSGDGRGTTWDNIVGPVRPLVHISGSVLLTDKEIDELVDDLGEPYAFESERHSVRTKSRKIIRQMHTLQP